MKISSIVRGKDDGVLDHDSNSGSDQKLSLSGYIFNIEPRFTDRLYKGVKVRSQKGLQVFWSLQFGDWDCHQVRRRWLRWGRFLLGKISEAQILEC